MISSAPRTIGEQAVSVALGQVCAAPTKNMTPGEGGAVCYIFFSNPYCLSPQLHLSDSPVYVSPFTEILLYDTYS